MTAATAPGVYPQVKLTEEQVRLARIYVEKGPKETLARIARRWDVQPPTLRQAVNRSNWKWLPAPTPAEIEATPLPDWLAGDHTVYRSHCSTCVHWDTRHSCTLSVPEAGGYFAACCAAFMLPA